MTTLPNRPKTALLVIDVQNGVVAPGRRAGIVPTAEVQFSAPA